MISGQQMISGQHQQQNHHYSTSSLTPNNMMTTGMMTTGGESTMREVDRRQASSTIIKEEYLGQMPEGEVRYVEVPVIEEVIKRVSKKEVIEVEKFVPRYEYEYVDRIVEIPQIQYIDRTVEVPQVQEIVRHVTKREVVDVPKEVVRHIPKIEHVVVEKTVEVPGQVIEIPKPYTVENKIPVARYVDNEVAMVVAQTIRPVITESRETVEVDVFEYEPQVVVVDVHVPKPVPSQLIAAGMVEEVHRLVTVPAAQYNSMLKMLNVHITETDQRSALPFISEASGAIPMLHGSESHVMYPAPIATAQIQGYIPGTASSQHFVTSTTTTTGNRHVAGGGMSYNQVGGSMSYQQGGGVSYQQVGGSARPITTYQGPSRFTTNGATSTTSKVITSHQENGIHLQQQGTRHVY